MPRLLWEIDPSAGTTVCALSLGMGQRVLRGGAAAPPTKGPCLLHWPHTQRGRRQQEPQRQQQSSTGKPPGQHAHNIHALPTKKGVAQSYYVSSFKAEGSLRKTTTQMVCSCGENSIWRGLQMLTMESTLAKLNPSYRTTCFLPTKLRRQTAACPAFYELPNKAWGCIITVSNYHCILKSNHSFFPLVLLFFRS